MPLSGGQLPLPVHKKEIPEHEREILRWKSFFPSRKSFFPKGKRTFRSADAIARRAITFVGAPKRKSRSTKGAGNEFLQAGIHFTWKTKCHGSRKAERTSHARCRLPPGTTARQGHPGRKGTGKGPWSRQRQGPLVVPKLIYFILMVAVALPALKLTPPKLPPARTPLPHPSA